MSIQNGGICMKIFSNKRLNTKIDSGFRQNDIIIMPVANYTIGIDVGGTKIAAILWDGQKVIADDVLATPTDNLNHLMIMFEALINPLLEKAKANKAKVVSIGLGVPGVIDYTQGKMLDSPNMPIINGVKIAEILQKRIGLPVKMDNDANCFARAEAVSGAGQKLKSVFGVIIGTGIGGAWWVNNGIYLGSHGGAGEPGQMVIDHERGIALETAYHQLMQNNPELMAEEAFRGDILAERSYEELGKIIGIAFANIINILDPEIIIIGGSAVKSSELFMSAVRQAVKTHVHSSETVRKIKIVKGKLGPLAGAIGAALLD